MRIAPRAVRDWIAVLSFVDAKHGGAAHALTERRDATAGRDMKTMSHIKETKVTRTSVDLADTQPQALDELSRKEKRSCAALIRRAIDEYLAK
jgi:Ribbon-helix-helix protein, copG family